jgi:hypothetical protein
VPCAHRDEQRRRLSQAAGRSRYSPIDSDDDRDGERPFDVCWPVVEVVLSVVVDLANGRIRLVEILR